MKKVLKIKYGKNKYLNLGLEIFKQEVEPTHKPKTIIRKEYNKVFCIGFHKTRTTSLERTLSLLGFRMGEQRVGEMLAQEVAQCNYERLLKLCHTADAFQDTPFMFGDVYKILDKEFPNSKFILTMRNDEEVWFNSLVKFHTKLFSSDKAQVPSVEDLANANYVYRGWVLDAKSALWGYPKTSLYDKEYYQRKYLNYNKEVIEYFIGRPNDLLLLNLEEPSSFARLCRFLHVESTPLKEFPWENKT